MFKNKIVVSLIFVGLLMGLLLFLNWVSLSQQRFGVYDINSYHRDGLKAVRLLLERTGYRLSEINSVPTNRAQLLIILTFGELPKKKQRELLDWVYSGGTIIELAQHRPTLLLDPEQAGEYTTFKKRTFTPEFKPFRGLSYHLNRHTVATISNPDLAMYGFQNHYFIYQYTWGQGNLIAWNDPDGLTNRYVKKYQDNAVIFALLVKRFAATPQIAVFNTNFLPLSPSPIQWKWNLIWNRYWIGFILCLSGLSLLLWKTAARFGRPRPMILAQGRSFNEFIYSMAGLFQQANIQSLVLDNLWHDLIKTIAQLTGLSSQLPLEELTEKLTHMTNKEYRGLVSLYQQSHANRNKLPKQQFLSFAHQLDSYRKELHEWKKSNHFTTKQ